MRHIDIGRPKGSEGIDSHDLGLNSPELNFEAPRNTRRATVSFGSMGYYFTGLEASQSNKRHGRYRWYTDTHQFVTNTPLYGFYGGTGGKGGHFAFYQSGYAVESGYVNVHYKYNQRADNYINATTLPAGTHQLPGIEHERTQNSKMFYLGHGTSTVADGNCYAYNFLLDSWASLTNFGTAADHMAVGQIAPFLLMEYNYWNGSTAVASAKYYYVPLDIHVAKTANTGQTGIDTGMSYTRYGEVWMYTPTVGATGAGSSFVWAYNAQTETFVSKTAYSGTGAGSFSGKMVFNKRHLTNIDTYSPPSTLCLDYDLAYETTKTLSSTATQQKVLLYQTPVF